VLEARLLGVYVRGEQAQHQWCRQVVRRVAELEPEDLRLRTERNRNRLGGVAKLG
jgi:hypothetical protein